MVHAIKDTILRLILEFQDIVDNVMMGPATWLEAGRLLLMDLVIFTQAAHHILKS